MWSGGGERALLDKVLPGRYLMKQLYETILACSNFFIGDRFERIHVIQGELTVISFWGEGCENTQRRKGHWLKTKATEMPHHSGEVFHVLGTGLPACDNLVGGHRNSKRTTSSPVGLQFLDFLGLNLFYLANSVLVPLVAWSTRYMDISPIIL